ncbi:hypothetical protein PM082_018197 [Marasmius tenuissimus]|nr:hypothetical protein PM082_018197 [Marasmius tenuissimus]
MSFDRAWTLVWCRRYPLFITNLEVPSLGSVTYSCNLSKPRRRRDVRAKPSLACSASAAWLEGPFVISVVALRFRQSRQLLLSDLGSLFSHRGRGNGPDLWYRKAFWEFEVGSLAEGLDCLLQYENLVIALPIFENHRFHFPLYLLPRRGRSFS